MATRNKYAATFSNGERITRESRTRSYSHAWALIGPKGQMMKSGFAANEGLASAAAATEQRSHAKAFALWQAGHHPQQNATSPQREFLQNYFAGPARAEVVAVETL